MSKIIFHSFSEIGILKQKFPRPSIDDGPINNSNSSKEKSDLQKDVLKIKKHKKNKQPLQKKIVINNVIVSSSGNDYQVASLIVREHKSMDNLEKLAVHYQDFFGPVKFEKIKSIAANLFEIEKHQKEVSYRPEFAAVRQNIKDGESISNTETTNSAQKPLEQNIFYYKRDPSRWYKEVHNESYHRCGKAFTCSCCGKPCKAGQGYRVDLKEIYFCTECKREIFKPEHPGDCRYMKIVYTNMGHKR